LFALAAILFTQSCTRQEDKYIEEENSKIQIQAKLDNQKESEPKTESDMHSSKDEADSGEYKKDNASHIDQSHVDNMQNNDVVYQDGITSSSDKSKQQDEAYLQNNQINDKVDAKQDTKQSIIDKSLDATERQAKSEDAAKEVNASGAKKQQDQIQRCSTNMEKFYEQADLENQNSPL